jgi:hypothetical protein
MIIDNKVISKFGDDARVGISGALWWINKANERYEAERTYCHRYVWRRNRRAKIKSYFVHYIFCKPCLLPHKPGGLIDTSKLPQFQGERLKRMHKKLFPEAYKIDPEP